ncbi:MAG: Superoxide dismutase [Mn], mitochondrial, partial [Paramarteilia canceri]
AYDNQKASNPKLNFGHIIQAFNPSIYFNAGGYLNHAFLWKTLSNKGEDKNPKCMKSKDSKLANAIKTAFGSIENMKTEMNNKSLTIQGSGWSWLCYNPESEALEISATANQETALDQL